MPNSATVAAQLAAYNAKPVTATDALNTALTQFGVPEIRNTVSGLRTTVANTTSALNNVDPSVTGRTSGSLVTEAQRQRLVNMERAPIAQNLTDENNSLTQNNQSLQDALGQATTQANNKVTDYNTGRAALEDEYKTAYQREQDAAQAADSAAKFAYQQQQDAISNRLNQQKVNISGRSGGGGGGGQAVDPASAFLNYIAGNFKAAGGAGNKNISRQTQDAWANAFFSQNGVSQANRQQYWDLFNKTYNRASNPTKDPRYKR